MKTDLRDILGIVIGIVGTFGVLFLLLYLWIFGARYIDLFDGITSSLYLIIAAAGGLLIFVMWVFTAIRDRIRRRNKF
jgi:hypothetical protein